MSEKKKNIMSRTEALLAEISDKLDKLIGIESYISSLMEADVAADKRMAEQATMVTLPTAKPKQEVKK